MILKKLGIYGWKEADENLLLSSLLTGDPLLLTGNHGCAKTHVASKMAQALGFRFLAYDASKAMFEDVLGFPNVEKLKQGVVEYVPSPVTIWDKEMILIDELNRAVPELQSKWLEIVRSRKIMGFPTQVKWIWSAMNPLSYSATNALDEALVGRFAIFLYPPDVLQMEEADRIRVAMHINGEDAPSLSVWTDGISVETVADEAVQDAGIGLRRILGSAGNHFLRLREQLVSLPEFLAKFADLLLRETDGQVALDGRRLGFVSRNLLANRAVEMAKTEECQASLPDFAASSRYVVQSSVPISMRDEGPNRQEVVHKLEICFDLLASYFEEDSDLSRVNRVYELFTTSDLMRKAELLLAEDLGEMTLSKAWTDLMAESRDITLLAYTALQVEARHPGTIPQELLASLASKVSPDRLSTECIPPLEGDSVEYVEEVESLLAQDSDLARLIAYQRVSQLADTGTVKPESLERTRESIAADLDAFEALLDGRCRKGGIPA